MKKVLLIILVFGIAYSAFGQRESDFLVTLTSDGTGVLITKYTGSATDVRTPATIEGMPVKEIGDEVFRHTSVTRVVFPEGVISLGDRVFYYIQSLTSVTLPSTLKKIGDEAFYFCGSLRTINLPAGITEIGRSAFAHTGLTSVTLPAGLTVINEGLFSYCRNLATIVIPEGVTTIYGGYMGVFNDCSLTAITLPSTIESIHGSPFGSIRTINIPESVTKIEFHGYLNISNLSLASQAALRRVGFVERMAP